jgi:predicted dehydrogenase
MVEDPAIDALWICSPNHARVANVEEIVRAIRDGVGALRGVVCEKPLGRNVREARRMVDLVESVELQSGYLENQVFFPSLRRAKDILWKRGAAIAGRPYLARATEEHGGPHAPWFWRGDLQGGGVLSDMMCHEVEAARFMLTDPGKSRSTLRPVRVTARTSNLKWAQPKYASKLASEMGEGVDFLRHPVEDYASAVVEFADEEDNTLVAELTNSWSYVGPGLRITMELLGPEYSMTLNTLDSGARLFFSREIKGGAGEDMVEKQNAETGLMPILANEAADYGYEAENRHMARAFLDGVRPMLTFAEGLEVVELLMMAYMSAEQGRTVDFRPADLDDFIPAVARRQGSHTGEPE